MNAAKKLISDEKHQKMAFDRAILWAAQGVSGKLLILAIGFLG